MSVVAVRTRVMDSYLVIFDLVGRSGGLLSFWWHCSSYQRMCVVVRVGSAIDVMVGPEVRCALCQQLGAFFLSFKCSKSKR